MEQNEGEVIYAIINNIPASYHSCDLRNYFSQFVESKGFECFHFRHRPERKSVPESVQTDRSAPCTEALQQRTTCCVVKLFPGKFRTFMKLYNRKHWVDKNGEVMAQVCYISKVKIPPETDSNNTLKTRGEAKQIPPDRENFTESDLRSLPELHPPDIMPNGNVGTPTMVFMDYINQCRLPPSIIKKLGLSFPKTRTSKQYGSVPFDYIGTAIEACDSKAPECAEVFTASGHEIIPEKIQHDRSECNSTSSTSVNRTECNSSETMNDRRDSSSKKYVRRNKRTWRDEEAKKRLKLNIEEKLIGKSEESEEDNDSCEEWERHEAMYDDPSNQERNKERLYEEEIELKWEKGGSGLVFYTDAQYWQAQEGDFDEQTADDWDVDMSAYYEEGAGDKDARDFLAMRQETRRREGIEATDRFSAGIAVKTKEKQKKRLDKGDKIGKFEAHTKGFGRKILEDQGWTEGQGLGSTITGMADALDNEGQNPRDRRGLGYHGEKLNRNPGRAQRKVMISTVYDDPTDTDPHEPLKRRHEPYHLKYRDEVKFSKSETININDDDNSVK